MREQPAAAKVAEAMSIEPKLMDPERLALIEQEESLMPVSMATGWSVAARQTEVLAVSQLIRELRAHAKHWEAEAERERLEGNRNRAAAVDAGEARMVEHAKAKRWRARCHVTAEDVEAAGVDSLTVHRWCVENTRSFRHALVNEAAGYINHMAANLARPAFDILDEMAAMDPS